MTTSSAPPNPSLLRVAPLREVRAQLRREHAEVLARMNRIDRNAVAAGKRDELAHLRGLLTHFANLLDAHIAFEERELGPLLRSFDRWGGIREAALKDEHEAHRLRLEAVRAMIEDASSRGHEVAGEVHWLVQTLADDMTRVDLELERIDRAASEPARR